MAAAHAATAPVVILRRSRMTNGTNASKPKHVPPWASMLRAASTATRRQAPRHRSPGSRLTRIASAQIASAPASIFGQT